MHGMLILLGAVVWLAFALAPLTLLFAKRKWIWGGLIGVPFMLAVLAAPFWDYFIMVPAINEAYARLAINKIYKISNARTIRVVNTENGVEIPSGPFYEESLWRGQLDYIETIKATQEKPGAKTVNTLVRYSRQPKNHPLCQEKTPWGSVGRLGGLRKEFCIIYQPISHSDAVVAIELGVVRVTPNQKFPEKTYQYTIWRATDMRDKSVIAVSIRGFIWDPDLCYWFNSCRYVVDDDWWLKNPSIERSVSTVVERK